MKKTLILTVVLIGLLSFTSCAKRITVSYQNSSENTGTIVLKPTKKNKASISVNDNLLVQEKNVKKSVKIKNVPIGQIKVQYVTESGFYKYDLDTTYVIDLKNENDKTVNKTVKVPPYNKWFYIMNGAIILLSLIFL